jgi:hypothetical protein
MVVCIDEGTTSHHGINLPHTEPATIRRMAACIFGRGYLSPYFGTDDERMEVVFEDAYILICDKPLSSKLDLVPLLELITKSGKPLLTVAEEVGAEALGTLVVNKLSGLFQIAAVKAPDSGDQRKRMLQNMTLRTGCQAFTQEFNIPLADLQISRLGQAQKVTIGKNSTVIEGRAKCNQLSFEPDDCIGSDSLSSPASSPQAQIAGGPPEVLPSRQLSADRLSLCNRSVVSDAPCSRFPIKHPEEIRVFCAQSFPLLIEVQNREVGTKVPPTRNNPRSRMLERYESHGLSGVF